MNISQKMDFSNLDILLLEQITKREIIVKSNTEMCKKHLEFFSYRSLWYIGFLVQASAFVWFTKLIILSSGVESGIVFILCIAMADGFRMGDGDIFPMTSEILIELSKKHIPNCKHCHTERIQERFKKESHYKIRHLYEYFLEDLDTERKETIGANGWFTLLYNKVVKAYKGIIKDLKNATTKVEKDAYTLVLKRVKQQKTVLEGQQEKLEKFLDRKEKFILEKLLPLRIMAQYELEEEMEATLSYGIEKLRQSSKLIMEQITSIQLGEAIMNVDSDKTQILLVEQIMKQVETLDMDFQ